MGEFSPLITFTLNRNLRSASSALKLHLTSSYKAWETEEKNHSEHIPEQHITNQPARDSCLSHKTHFPQEPLCPSLAISTRFHFSRHRMTNPRTEELRLSQQLCALQAAPVLLQTHCRSNPAGSEQTTALKFLSQRFDLLLASKKN